MAELCSSAMCRSGLPSSDWSSELQVASAQLQCSDMRDPFCCMDQLHKHMPSLARASRSPRSSRLCTHATAVLACAAARASTSLMTEPLEQGFIDMQGTEGAVGCAAEQGLRAEDAEAAGGEGGWPRSQAGVSLLSWSFTFSCIRESMTTCKHDSVTTCKHDSVKRSQLMEVEGAPAPVSYLCSHYSVPSRMISGSISCAD